MIEYLRYIIMYKNFIELFFSFFNKIEQLIGTEKAQEVSLNGGMPICKFLEKLDNYIKYYFYCNFIMLLGLFINFIFSIKFVFNFSDSYNYAFYGNLYLSLYFVESIIFMILTQKYLKFVFKWTALQKHYLSHHKLMINQLLSELKAIVPKFYYDTWRYIFLLMFLGLLFSRPWIETKYPFNFSFRSEIFFISVLLIASLIVWIEWPSYCLWKYLKRNYKLLS